MRTPSFASRLALTWTTVLAVPAAAQSFNLDVGTGAGVPPPTYGAASGQQGAWHGIADPLSAIPNLVDVQGVSTPVVLTVVGNLTTFSQNDPATPTPHEELVDDGVRVGVGIGDTTTWTFTSLQDGDYEVYVYGRSSIDTLADLNVKSPQANESMQVLFGVPWTQILDHVGGKTYCRLTVTVSGGTLVVTTSDAQGGGDKAMLNGFQLVKVDVAVPYFGAKRVVLDSATQPGPGRLADLNADGKLDVIVADLTPGGGGAAWFASQGGGAFASEVFLDAGRSGAGQPFVADLDGDGDLDVAQTYSAEGRIVWYRNMGGSFSSANLVDALQPDPMQVVALDVDLDGDRDLLASFASGEPYRRYTNLGGGVFGPGQVAVAGAGANGTLEVADIDGDGDEDVASARRDVPDLIWLESTGAGSFALHTALAVGLQAPVSVSAGDLDADGDRDLAYADAQAGSFAWIRNLGGGSFGPPLVLSSNAPEASCVAVTDLDEDGDNDVMAAALGDERVRFFRQTSPGVLSAHNDLGQHADGVHFLAYGEMEGNAHKDAVYVAEGDLAIVWKSGTGGASYLSLPFQVANASKLPVALRAGDLDGDGDPDLASANGSGEFFTWSENLGGGQFELATPIVGAPHATADLVIADLDGNGWRDIVSAYWPAPAPGAMLWFRNLGQALFAAPQDFGTFQFNPMDLDVVDLDGDGDLDVLGASFVLIDLFWYPNLGGGNFGPETTIFDDGTSIGGNTHIRTGDLDGDGDLDVLAPTQGSAPGEMFWLANLGGAAGWSPPNYVESNSLFGPIDLRVADLDGNGLQDIVTVTLTNGGRMRWYRNLGGSSFAPGVNITEVIAGVDNVSAADIDGDGDLDLASGIELPANGPYGWLIIENLGGGQFSGPTFYGEPQSADLDIRLEDADGDGDPDFLAGGLDGVSSWSPNQRTVGSKYCTAIPNSLGVAAAISATGSRSTSAGTLSLHASGVPDGNGIFFHGTQQNLVPFGNGNLCIGGSLLRGSIVFMSGGSAHYTFDNSNSTHDLQAFAGTTRHFQFWFRDVAGGGALFNLSDAVSIDLLP